MAPPRKKQRLTNDVAPSGNSPPVATRENPVPDGHPAGEADTAVSASPSADAPTKQSSSLFVRSLPASTTTEALTELFSNTYPIKHATAVLDRETSQCKGYGFVTFADPEDAARAKQEFNGHVFGGRKLRVEIAEKRSREKDESGRAVVKEKIGRRPEVVKKSASSTTSTRLIVRNLPWSVKHADQLEAVFKKYGRVKKAVLPKKKTGLLAGFGFVMMGTRAEAEKALADANGMEIDARPVAVDWAVDKETFAKQEESTPAGDDDNGAENGGDDDDDDDDDESNADRGGGESESEGRSVQDDEMDTDEMDLDDMYDGETAEKMRTEDRSRTLFVRNLPFTCTDENLEDHFSRFGSIRYARVVMDHATDRSKGTGFVAFYDNDEAEACLRNAPRSQPAARDSEPAKTQSILQDEKRDPSGQYTLDGRVLQVSRAVDKSEANRLTKEGVNYRFNRDKDKRRLYLLSEGTIASNTPLWESLPPSEQAMRESSAKQRKSIIDSNPSLHLSLTRLSVRNIPRSVTSKDLKQLAREAVVGFATDVKAGKRERISKEELSRGGEEMIAAEAARKRSAKGIVRQAKIVFEGQEGGKVDEKTGGGRSRGYGFIEYYTHRSALMGLRWLNGHVVDYKTVEQGRKKKASIEAVQDRKKRLIVEFAIENAQVVGRRRERENKAREHARDGGKDEKGDSRKGRGGDKGKSERSEKGGKKRKRAVEDDGAAGKVDVTEKTAVDEKLAKKQRIVQRKRMARRERKQGKA